MNICASPLSFTDKVSAIRSPREERLRATAGIENSLALSSWRGRSGRRYVVGVRYLGDIVAEDLTGAVLVAVRRDEIGAARVVDVACGASGREARSEARLEGWLEAVAARGASEVHVHLLAADEAARKAVARDLRG